MTSAVTLERGPPVSGRRERKGARAPAGLLPGMRVGLYWAGSVGLVRPAWLPPLFFNLFLFQRNNQIIAFEIRFQLDSNQLVKIHKINIDSKYTIWEHFTQILFTKIPLGIKR